MDGEFKSSEFQSILESLGAGGTQTKRPTDGVNNDAIIKVLSDRLEKQGKGIASSSTTKLNQAINSAINSTQVAGDLGSKALDVARQREVGFLQDRALNKITTAREGQSGYAQQVAALRELTDTVTKEVKDLDQRYQEAILQNDAATAQRIADLKVKKLELAQKAEESFYANMFRAAQLEQGNRAMQIQNEQFYAEQEAAQKRMMFQAAQSEYQFTRNLGLQFKQLDLQKQQLDLQRSQYKLSLKKYNQEVKKIEDEKKLTSTKYLVAQSLTNMVKNGQDLNEIDPITLVPTMMQMTGYDGNAEDFNKILFEAWTEVKSQDIPPIEADTGFGYWDAVIAGTDNLSSIADIPAAAAALPVRAFRAWKDAVGF